MLRLAPLLVTPPTVSVVSLGSAKAHLRVEHDEDDALIAAQVAAATSLVDSIGWLGRCLSPQVWSQGYTGWASGRLRLPFPDAAAATVAVSYVDTDDQDQTLSAEAYDVVPTISGTEILRRPSVSWPPLAHRPVPVTVEASYGFGEIPPAVAAAILLMVGDLYRFRETAVIGAVSQSVSMTPTVEALLAPWRCGFAAA